MSTFAKTRVAAEYAARHCRTELARSRLTVLLQRLSVCEAALASRDGQPPVTAAGLLRSLVQAVAGLAGPAWLAASDHDPDVAAFTTLQATASPPDPARIDEICSRVLWARFAPAGTARDGTGGDAPHSGQPAPGKEADGGTGTVAMRAELPRASRWPVSGRRRSRTSPPGTSRKCTAVMQPAIRFPGTHTATRAAACGSCSGQTWNIVKRA